MKRNSFVSSMGIQMALKRKAHHCLRPRVQGAREEEIFEATLEVLEHVGYDRLTMDKVAQHARASKATLYRRWPSKVALVIEAINCMQHPEALPDTGNLRDDLLSFFGSGDLAQEKSIATLGAVLTALACDPEFAEAFRAKVIAPKVAATTELYRRAIARGEIRPDIDLDLITHAIAALVLHRHYLMGDPPGLALLSRVIDNLILPAVTASPVATGDLTGIGKK
jgi:AcrR family transcriptional regulator